MNHVFMEEATKLAVENVLKGSGGPFGCVIVKEGKIVGKGSNQVTVENDPTAHAEVKAIRDACNNLNTFQLEGCTIYTSCEPCPMCLGAIYWARPEEVIYASTKEEAAKINFDDKFIYEELEKEKEERMIPFKRMTLDKYNEPFDLWEKKENKVEY